MSGTENRKAETTQKRQRMQELVDLLNQAGRAYYQESREIMSNYEYDALYDELVQLEKELHVTLAGSPTIHVGYEVVSELPKERHESPMLSLDKTKDVEDLRAFAGHVLEDGRAHHRPHLPERGAGEGCYPGER